MRVQNPRVHVRRRRARSPTSHPREGGVAQRPAKTPIPNAPHGECVVLDALDVVQPVRSARPGQVHDRDSGLLRGCERVLADEDAGAGALDGRVLGCEEDDARDGPLRTPVEERAGPQLEVERPPELHPRVGSPRRCCSSRRRAAAASTRPRSAKDCEANTSAARSPSGPRSQCFSGVTNPSLSRRSRTGSGGDRRARGAARPSSGRRGSARLPRGRTQAPRSDSRGTGTRAPASAPSRCTVLVAEELGQPAARQQERLVAGSRSSNDATPFNRRRGRRTGARGPRAGRLRASASGRGA